MNLIEFESIKKLINLFSENSYSNAISEERLNVCSEIIDEIHVKFPFLDSNDLADLFAFFILDLFEQQENWTQRHLQDLVYDVYTAISCLINENEQDEWGNQSGVDFHKWANQRLGNSYYYNFNDLNRSPEDFSDGNLY